MNSLRDNLPQRRWFISSLQRSQSFKWETALRNIHKTIVVRIMTAPITCHAVYTPYEKYSARNTKQNNSSPRWLLLKKEYKGSTWRNRPMTETKICRKKERFMRSKKQNSRGFSDLPKIPEIMKLFCVKAI
jgi:ribosomal protein L39E